MASKTELTLIEKDWDKYNNEFPKLEALRNTHTKMALDKKKGEADCMKTIKHQLLCVGRISQSLQCYRCASNEEQEKTSKLKKEIAVREHDLREMLKILPKNTGLYLNVVLGSMNFTLLTEEEKFKYKEKYEQFKLNVTLVTFLLSVLHLIFLNSHTLDALLHFLLFWYYCTLTIRETILQVNGSRMKGWWRAHHFNTASLAGVLIVWPDGTSYQHFRKPFLFYSCYVSVLQFMQYGYQQGCLHRLRQLGESYNMAITVDGFHSWMWKSLKCLLPFLSLGYIWQLYNSIFLYKTYISSGGREWQVGASATLFLILFVGNSFTTATVVHRKLREKALVSEKSK